MLEIFVTFNRMTYRLISNLNQIEPITKQSERKSVNRAIAGNRNLFGNNMLKPEVGFPFLHHISCSYHAGKHVVCFIVALLILAFCIAYSFLLCAGKLN